jgi:hypothetical protein
MILTFIIGIIIIFYCLINLLDINMFINKFHGAKIAPTIDSYVIISSFIWFIIQSFMCSGPIVILTLSIITFIETYEINISRRKQRMLMRFILISIVLLISFIILNEVYLNFNIWEFIFNI